jgi:hypothetical protein
MSYEGYEQHICENGHRFNTEAGYAYFGDDNPPACPYCGAKSVFCNCVDQTNCEDMGVILNDGWRKFEVFPMVIHECCECNSRRISPPIYRIPTRKEAEKIQMYWDYVKQKHFPIADYAENWELNKTAGPLE